MTRFVVAAFALVLSLGTGCAPAPAQPAPKTASAAVAAPASVSVSEPTFEVRELAPGVELRVNPKASPGARDAADRLQAEYRATYLNAR